MVTLVIGMVITTRGSLMVITTRGSLIKNCRSKLHQHLWGGARVTFVVTCMVLHGSTEASQSSTVYIYIQTAKQWTHKIPLSEELGMSHMYYCYINSNIYSKVCTIAFVTWVWRGFFEWYKRSLETWVLQQYWRCYIQGLGNSHFKRNNPCITAILWSKQSPNKHICWCIWHIYV